MIRAMTAIGAATVAACAGGLAPSMPAPTPDGVRFTASFPDASSVAVAGSFNQWSVDRHPLSRDRSGAWSVVVPLAPGEYAFMYVVDGIRWVTPALAEDFVDDGFGARNGVVVVRAIAR